MSDNDFIASLIREHLERQITERAVRALGSWLDYTEWMFDPGRVAEAEAREWLISVEFAEIEELAERYGFA